VVANIVRREEPGEDAIPVVVIGELSQQHLVLQGQPRVLVVGQAIRVELNLKPDNSCLGSEDTYTVAARLFPAYDAACFDLGDSKLWFGSSCFWRR
jgi:hypothetical protein